MKTKNNTLLRAFARVPIGSRQLVNSIVSVFAAGWFAMSAPAQSIFDPFNYPPGATLAGQSPFAPLVWYAAGPAGPQQARVQAGVLQWPGLSNSAPNRVNIVAGNGPSSVFVFGTPDPADIYPPITANTIYFSFILRVTDLTGLGAGGNYFAGFAPDQGGGAATPANVFTRVLLRTSGAGYNIGLDKSSGVLANYQWDARVFNVGDTVLIVGAYIFSSENADISQLWINPDPTTFCSPTPPAYTLQSTAGVDATQLASVAYIQRPTPAQPTAMLTDELRVSQFWDGVVRPGWDYPDAPGSYRTLFADNAARHTVVPGVSMGTQIDVECDGLPTPPADGDDLNNLDDGDGVTWLPGPWVIDSTRNITVTVSVDGKLDAYFDWNKNNSFDPGEKVFASVDVFAAAPNTLTVTVPPGAATGFTYARFRFSTVGGLGAVGPAPDGEVEDYRIQVQAPPPPPPDLALDVSAAPQPVIDGSNLTYSITVSNKGAGVASGVLVSHGYINHNLPLGLSVTASTSQGSCSNTTNGVECNLGTLQPGGTATISVVGIPDFNQLATLYNIPEMQETISVSNSVSVASAETDATPADNLAVVVLGVVPLRDFGDAPSPPYPTLLPDGPRHWLSALRFGTLLDAELDGQPVNLDDTTGAADEVTDGFTFPAGGLYVSGFTPIEIQVSGPGGYIDLWIERDGIPPWTTADQVIAANWHPGGGAVMPFMISIPPGTVTGPAWARARVHRSPAGLPTTGYGGVGEVVDFQIDILPATVDLGLVADPTQVIRTEGELLAQSYTIVNKGPSTAFGTRLDAHLPPGVTLENLQLSQGTGQMEGTNLVCHLGALPPNGSALVTFTAGTSNIFDGRTVEFSDVSINVSSVEIELNPDDNMHHGMVRVFAARDFADAPYSDTYHTREIHDGARHRIGGPFFGGSPAGHVHRDEDPDGMPSINADGDDVSDGNNDERGVRFLDPLILGSTTVRIEINAPLGGRVDGFIDWNHNRSWDDLEDQVFLSLPVPAGVSVYTISVPPSALLGDTYARFRISTAGGLSDRGYVNNGEVEDYKVLVEAAPSPPDLAVALDVLPGSVISTSNLVCSVTVSNGGAGVATGTLLTLPLPTGVAFAAAAASQGSCSNSQSGVQCALGTLQPGGTATVNVVGIPDFDQLAAALNIPETQETISLSNSVSVVATEADANPLNNTATAITLVLPLRDFGDAPVPTYPTLLPNGARHRVGNLRFGTLLDAESNGQPVDLDGADELPDGFGLPAGAYLGGLMPITIQVSGPAGYIDFWIDMDGVSGWGAADHVLVAAAHPGGGAVVGYGIPIPAGAVPGMSWARARVHKNPAGLPATGYGGFGEVADFQVTILLAAVDLVAVANPTSLQVTEGDSFTSIITVSNKGPSTATGVLLTSTLPSGVTVASNSNSAGACQVQGSNIVCTVSNLAAQQSFNVQAVFSINSQIFNEIEDFEANLRAEVSAAQPDLNLSNNVAVVSVVVSPHRDFGDAPDPTVGPAYHYPTRLVDNGARHRIIGPYFGGSPAGVPNRDPDPDGVPTLNADGDDLLDANDDEEGITFLDPIFPGATGVRVRINAPLGGKVDAWLDFNRNGAWTMGAPEQIFTSLAVAAGTFDYTFNVPAGAVVGPTYARFRISSAGGLAFTGYATNGEVQDLTLTILPAIDIDVVPVGATSLQFDDNEPFPLALRVSNKGSNTATGVQLSATLPEHVTVQSIISSNGSCQVNGSNVICQLASLAPGQNSQFGFLLEVVADDLPGDDFYDLGDLTVMATAAESDVHFEDNQFVVPTRVLFAQDWADAPAGYPVTNAGNGARHRAYLLTPLRLGTGWDRESDGTPSPGADYDDTHGATPDDEDGVVFVSTTGTITVDVTVTGNGHVDAWLNFNRDFDWEDAGEQILISEPFSSETRRFSITVPAGTTAGDFVSRWRVSKDGGLTSKGPGGRGEVEDHVCNWTPETVSTNDFGDAPDVNYKTYNVSGGPSHVIVAGEYLGLTIDGEADGQPIDLDGADEDGVGLPPVLVPGTVAYINVTASVAGKLNAWIDFNHNLTFDTGVGSPEPVCVDVMLAPGANAIPISVPAGAVAGGTWARFRFSLAGGLAPGGPAPDGEVEDYGPDKVIIGNNPNPNPVYFAGLPHTALSNATVTVTSNRLQVANLGSSGQDGVRINLGRSQGWRASVTRQPVPASFTTVYSINIVGVTGETSNQVLATMRLERQGSNLLFSADFSGLGASQYTAAFYDTNGTQVNNTRPFQNLEVVPLFPDCPDGYIPDCEWVSFLDSTTGGMHFGFLLCRGCLKFPDDTTFPGDGPIFCLLTPVAPTRTADYLSAVEIRGGSTTPSNSTSILLTSEATRHLDHWHRVVGGAALYTEDTNGTPTLRVRNLGSSGQDGIETIVGGPEYIGELPAGNLLRQRVVQFWDIGWLDGWFSTPSNSHVRWTATGRTQGSSNAAENLSDVIVYPLPLPGFNGEQGTMLSTRFDGIGATQARVEVFNGPAFVGSVTLPVGDLGTIGAGSVRRVSAQIIDGAPVWNFWSGTGWVNDDGFRPRDGSPALHGDRLRIIPLNPTTTVEGLRSLITRGANVESFAFRGFNTVDPQRPRLGTPRLLPNGRVTLRFSTEPDVAYQIEASPSVIDPYWTSLGNVMGTDGLNETEFEDTVLHISNRVRLFRVRIR